MFCTDVAARGLDVSNVHFVVQFDAPQDPAFYVHRVGRSARAGKEGSSLLFLTRKRKRTLIYCEIEKYPCRYCLDTKHAALLTLQLRCVKRGCRLKRILRLVNKLAIRFETSEMPRIKN